MIFNYFYDPSIIIVSDYTYSNSSSSIILEDILISETEENVYFPLFLLAEAPANIISKKLVLRNTKKRNKNNNYFMLNHSNALFQQSIVR